MILHIRINLSVIKFIHYWTIRDPMVENFSRGSTKKHTLHIAFARDIFIISKITHFRFCILK